MINDDARGVDGMITVTNDEICAAIKSAFNETRSVLEPAGALALAGLQKYMQETNETCALPRSHIMVGL